MFEPCRDSTSRDGRVCCSLCDRTPLQQTQISHVSWWIRIKPRARLASDPLQRTPLPGSAALRSALDSAASVSPFACESSAARPVELESSMPRDQRSLSGLLNPEEPPNLMVTSGQLAYVSVLSPHVPAAVLWRYVMHAARYTMDAGSCRGWLCGCVLTLS